MAEYIRVRMVRSLINTTKSQQATVASLGLRKIGQTHVLPKNDAIMGMCTTVAHLVSWEDSDGPDTETK